MLTRPKDSTNCANRSSRLGAIRKTIDDGRKYRDGAKYRPQLLLFATVAAAVILAGVVLAYRVSYIVLGQLNNVYRFSVLQKAATNVPVSNLRNPGEDRELYAVLSLEPSIMTEAPTAEAKEQLYSSVHSLEDGARRILSDVGIRILDDPSRGLVALKPRPSKCSVVHAGGTPKDLVSETRSLGIRLKPAVNNKISNITVTPIWRDANQVSHAIDSSRFVEQPLLPGSLICLSNDASWFLLWQPASNNQVYSPPFIQRITWIRTAPVLAPSSLDGNWYPITQTPRQLGTWPSLEAFKKLSLEFDNLVQSGVEQVNSFRIDDRAGFLIPLESHQTAMLWTNAAVADPDPVVDNPAAVDPLETRCTFKEVDPWDKSARQLFSCDSGIVEIENRKHRLRASYFSDQSKYFGSNTDSTTKQLCRTPSDPCTTELQISFYDEDQVKTQGSERINIQHFSSQIVGMTISGSYLLVRDANGQRWRYSIGSRSLLPLLQARWRGLDYEAIKDSEFSNLCKLMGCEKIQIPDWPQEPRRGTQ